MVHIDDISWAYKDPRGISFWYRIKPLEDFGISIYNIERSRMGSLTGKQWYWLDLYENLEIRADMILDIGVPQIGYIDINLQEGRFKSNYYGAEILDISMIEIIETINPDQLELNFETV